MNTPYGQSGDQIEKLMLLSMWSNYLYKLQVSTSNSTNQLIFAGLGKPSYPINQNTVRSYKKYWDQIEKQAELWHSNPNHEIENCAIDYGDPHGDLHARTLMAEAMSNWYDTDISVDNILFTVGGIGGLKIIFNALNNLHAPKFRVITPFPFYPAYANNPHHILHPIDVMSNSGYQLTAKSLETSIKSAYELSEKDGYLPKAILICNPSNPLGTIVKENELQKIALVLEKYPDLQVIIDEAYAEMNFIDIPSFFHHAPELKQRMIVLRSATKALSAAGERLAVLLVFNPAIKNELIKEQITAYVHPPRSSQLAYSETMLNFSQDERNSMSSYYQTKVNYVMNRLKNMGAEMPCPFYQVEATFYALGDFSDLMGMEIPSEAEITLGKKGLIQTGEELVYSLLFKDSLMLAPLSYFGLSEDCGYLRITCSAKSDELKEMMDRLEKRLLEARILKNSFLVDEINLKILYLKKCHYNISKSLIEQLDTIQKMNSSSLGFKQKNIELNLLLITIDKTLKNHQRIGANSSSI